MVIQSFLWSGETEGRVVSWAQAQVSRLLAQCFSLAPQLQLGTEI